MIKEGVMVRVEEGSPLAQQRWHPVGVMLVQLEWEPDELFNVLLGFYALDLYRLICHVFCISNL
jgi:hypothetical protein